MLSFSYLRTTENSSCLWLAFYKHLCNLSAEKKTKPIRFLTSKRITIGRHGSKGPSSWQQIPEELILSWHQGVNLYECHGGQVGKKLVAMVISFSVVAMATTIQFDRSNHT